MKGLAMLVSETFSKGIRFYSSTSAFRTISHHSVPHKLACYRPIAQLSMLANSNFDYDSISIPIEPIDFNKGFKMPTKREKTALEKLNSHPNDDLLSFEPIQHVYSFNGKKMKTSVTAFIESYFSKFIPDEIIPKMMNGNNWPRPEYTWPDGNPFTAEQIKKKWNDGGEYARNKGTWMHYNIERYLNNLAVDMTQPEMTYFLQFHEEYIAKPKITTYRTEWSIAAPDLGIGGSIDFVGALPNGNLVLMDWKRSKKLVDNLQDTYGKTAKDPISHFDDCEGSKYSLQLNMYRYILQTYYGKTVEAMTIGSFHPKLEQYTMVKVPALDDEIQSMIDDYIAKSD